MLTNKPKTKILVDGGDPEDTLRVKKLLGFVDGQTTNPTLIAKNPDIQRGIASGPTLSPQDEKDEYRKIVRAISPLVGDAGVSIEVFADIDTTAEDMPAQGEEMFSWIPNAYIKYPCTREGLRAAEMSVARQIRVNMTMCFSQDQAAAVHAATKGSKAPVYVSPFVGRLDDHGENGMGVVKYIKRMYSNGDGHVYVLAASIRHLDHLLASVGQNTQSKPTVAQELPPERITETYSVYEAALQNPPADNTGEPQMYFIADRTGQTYGIADPEKCIVAPEADRQALEQAVDDFRSQNGKVYRIVNRFNLNGHTVRLLNEAQEKQIQLDWFKRQEPLLGTTEIIRLSRVGFGNDRSLAIVVVSHHCGSLCGNESWRIFKRSKDKWVEQQWTTCVVVSSLLQNPEHSSAGVLSANGSWAAQSIDVKDREL